jgi:TIR domain
MPPAITPLDMLTGQEPVKVFLCHDGEHPESVFRLREQLLEAGFRAWLADADLQPGQDWRAETGRFLAKTDLMLVCISEKASKDRHLSEQLLVSLHLASERFDTGAILRDGVKAPFAVPTGRTDYSDLVSQLAKANMPRASAPAEPAPAPSLDEVVTEPQRAAAYEEDEALVRLDPFRKKPAPVRTGWQELMQRLGPGVWAAAALMVAVFGIMMWWWAGGSAHAQARPKSTEDTAAYANTEQSARLQPHPALPSSDKAQVAVVGSTKARR